MSFGKANDLGTTAGSLVLPGIVLATVVLAGTAAVILGWLGSNFAIYSLAVFLGVVGFIGIGGMVAVTRKEPLRFAFLALIFFLPIASVPVPPGRFAITIFYLVMIMLTIVLIGNKAFVSSKASGPLFPTRSLLIAWLFSIPCVIFSQFPLLSLWTFINIFTVYVFFLFMLNELRRERGFERLILLLSLVLIFIAIGIFIDHVLHVNLSLEPGNPNQLSYAAGLEIWRAGGFFQDPQMAAQFLACTITFLTLLSARDRFGGRKMRVLVWIAIAFGSVALLMTVSRSAILTCLVVTGISLFFFNRWGFAARLTITGITMLFVILIALTPTETWLNIVPRELTERFLTSGEALEDRAKIWFDTWGMFADHPFTGIGLGSFQSYLIATRPAVFNYYGIGLSEGITYIPEEPESGYFKILYEGGIAGSVAALLVVSDALRRAIIVVTGRNSDPDARTEVITALAGLITFGVTFVTLFTLADERNAAILAFLLAVIWYRSLQGEHGARQA